LVCIAGFVARARWKSAPPVNEGAPEKTGVPDSVGLPVKVPARLPPAARAAVPLMVMFPEKTGLPV
jgi:hypothetical protein